MKTNQALHISIGDLHGHLKALVKLLSHLDKEIGIFQDVKTFELKPNIQIIFTGDYIDRGANSRATIETVMELQAANPNNVTCLMGNHELLALADLENAKTLFESFKKEEHLLNYYKHTLHGANGGTAFIKNFGDTDSHALENYIKCMSREEDLGTWIRNLDPFAIKTAHGKRTLYVHGGIPKGLRDPQKLGAHAEKFQKHMETKTGSLHGNSTEKYSPENPLVGENSPYWDRSFHKLSTNEAKEITKKLGVDYIVIGHTPQRNGSPASYGDCIFNMDVGMCPAYGENTPAALIMTENGPQLFQPETNLEPLLKAKTPSKETEIGTNELQP